MRIAIFMLIFASAFAAELPRTGKIVVPSKVRLSWDAPPDSEGVTGYKITAIGSLGSATHYIDYFYSTDSAKCGIIDVSGIVPDSCIDRVRFYVQAYNGQYSEPSDTVDMPMARSRYLFGDLNYDGKVDVRDSAELWRRGMIGAVKGSAAYDPSFDVDVDGRITVIEHVAFIQNLGRAL